MNGLTTVFEIAPGSNGVRADAFLRVAVGVVVLTGGLIGLFRAKKLKKLAAPAVMTAWSVVWLIAQIPLLRIGTTQISHLLDVYHHGKSQVVEGFVHVSHQQPPHGHSSGDKIMVGDQTFEVNYFLVTPGYKQTISHGGVLREGIFARLHYYDGVILKVEIGDKNSHPATAANGRLPVAQ
jgi:hypothetical protein